MSRSPSPTAINGITIRVRGTAWADAGVVPGSRATNTAATSNSRPSADAAAQASRRGTRGGVGGERGTERRFDRWSGSGGTRVGRRDVIAEAVADAMQGMQPARMVGVLAQRVPQQGDHPVEHAGGDVAVAPHRVEDLVAAERAARFRRQQRQHVERLRFQRAHLAVAQQLAASQVDDHAVEHDAGGSG